MSNVTPISKARQGKRIGYTLEVSPADIEGFTRYVVLSPDGAVYCEGMRKGTEKEVAEVYQKTVKRLNVSAGFKSAPWSKTTVNTEHPAALLHWKRPFKEA